MPNVHKSAAVPFVNQKGERSMKRVKVARYVAGKKPAYAKDDDDDEYYTTDDEDDDFMDNEQVSSEQEETEDNSEEILRKPLAYQRGETSSESKSNCDRPTTPPVDDEDDDDDPRFARLKQLESKPGADKLLQVQTTSRVINKLEEGPVVIDDEDEDEIKERHYLARARTIEEIVETKSTLSDFKDAQIAHDLQEDEEETSKRNNTEDILDRIVITRIKPQDEIKKEEEILEEQAKLMIEEAKQKSILIAQVHQRIKEENELEVEIEARKKGDIGAIEMELVRTDDEDDDIAYEEWKLREIKRVLRDRSERALQVRVR